jgi:hypothetical protein
MPGIEPGALRFSREDATPSLLWKIIDQLRPIGKLISSGSRDLHPDHQINAECRV